MINFAEGKIKLGEKNILAASENELDSLAKECIIKRQRDAVGAYYYFEDKGGEMRFGVFISLKKRKIDWIRLIWLDSPVKSWSDVSDKAMMDEYRVLLKFVEKELGAPPDHIENRKSIWRLKWGKIDVVYEPRAYQADIFMEPQ